MHTSTYVRTTCAAGHTHEPTPVEALFTTICARVHRRVQYLLLRKGKISPENRPTEQIAGVPTYSRTSCCAR